MSERAALTKTPQKKARESLSTKPKENLSQSMDTPVEQILHLQRTIGNQAVQRLIKNGQKNNPAGVNIRQFYREPRIAKEDAGVPACPDGVRSLPFTDMQRFYEWYGTRNFCVTQNSISVDYRARWYPPPGPSTGRFRTQIRDMHRGGWRGRTAIWNVGSGNDQFDVPRPGAYWLRYEVINPSTNPGRRKQMEVTSDISEP